MSQSIWLIEKKEFGYRPFQNGDWQISSVELGADEVTTRRIIKKLEKKADEYTAYRAVEYCRKEEK